MRTLVDSGCSVYFAAALCASFCGPTLAEQAQHSPLTANLVEIQRLKAQPGVRCGVFLPSGQEVLTCGYVLTSRISEGVPVSSIGSIELWNLQSNKVIRSFKGESRGVVSISLSPDGALGLTAASYSQQHLTLWRLETGQEVRRFEGHTGGVNDVVFLPDGKRALSASYDQTIRLWDINSGVELAVLQGHVSYVWCVDVSPDGRFALSGAHAGSKHDEEGAPHYGRHNLILWDLAEKRAVGRFVGHESSVLSVSFSPDGNLAVSGGHDKVLRLWDVKTHSVVRSFEGHSGFVTCVVFCPSGTHILSASLDKTVRLWDVEAGSEVARIDCPSQANSVAVSPNGGRAIVACNDGSVLLLRISK